MIRISKDNTVFTRVFRNGEEFYALYKATANQNENTSNMNYSSFIRNIKENKYNFHQCWNFFLGHLSIVVFFTPLFGPLYVTNINIHLQWKIRRSSSNDTCSIDGSTVNHLAGILNTSSNENLVASMILPPSPGV